MNKRFYLFIVSLLALSACVETQRPLVYLPRSQGLISPRGTPEGRGLNLPSSKSSLLPGPNLDLRPEVERELRVLNKGGFVDLAFDRVRDDWENLQQIFEDEGVPPELLSVALVESGFRSNAKSGAGAVGMWQLMRGTAQLYGLKVGFLQDQRKDPYLSSIAAARHLRDLYHMYKDWHLAIAAYNAGTSSINRSLIKSKSGNFWELAKSGLLTDETTKFVPKVIAATLIVKQRSAVG